MLKRKRKQLLKARLKAKGLVIGGRQQQLCEKKTSLQSNKGVPGGEAWSALGLHDNIVRSLLEKLGFSSPTEIQKEALPPAIHGKHDIIGAAETVNNNGMYTYSLTLGAILLLI